MRPISARSDGNSLHPGPATCRTRFDLIVDLALAIASWDWLAALISENIRVAHGQVRSMTSRPCRDSTARAQTAQRVIVVLIGSLAQSVAAPASLLPEDMFQELWWAFGGMVAQQSGSVGSLGGRLEVDGPGKHEVRRVSHDDATVVAEQHHIVRRPRVRPRRR